MSSLGSGGGTDSGLDLFFMGGCTGLILWCCTCVLPFCVLPCC